MVPKKEKIESKCVIPTHLKVDKEIDVKFLEQAVFEYIKLQPNLNTGVKIINDKSFFVPLETITDVFEVLPSEQDVREFCFKLSNTKLRDDFEHFSALKVFYIPQSTTDVYIVPVFAHYCADGTNGMAIVHGILDTYEKLKYNIPINKTAFNPPPSLQDMISSGYGTIDVDKAKQRFIKTQLESLKKCNAVFPFEENEPPSTDHIYYLSTCKDYENFIKICRRENVTVGIALLTAMNYGYAGYLYNNLPESTPDTISISSDLCVNLRDRVDNNVSWSCVNFCVSQILVTTTFKKTDAFWDIARMTKEVLSSYINEQKFYNFDFELIEEIQKTKIVEDIKEKTPGVSFSHCVSNMKRYPSSVSYEDFSIESIHCVGGQFITGRDVMELMIYSTNKFNLSIIHRYGDKNKKRAEEVMKYIAFVIENCAKLRSDFDLIEIIEKSN